MSLRLRYFLLISAGLAAAIAVAPVAAADSEWPVAGAESARDTIVDLQAQGYDVQINWITGTSRVPLSRCSVSGIHNPNSSPPNGNTLETVYVDVVCPNEDWDSGGFGVGVGIG
jgi:hypothetical protein